MLRLFSDNVMLIFKKIASFGLKYGHSLMLFDDYNFYIWRNYIFYEEVI